MARKKPVYSSMSKPLYCHSRPRYITTSSLWAASPDQFSPLYHAKQKELEAQWATTSELEGVERPVAYKAVIENDEFVPISSTQGFAATLRNPGGRSADTLHMALANSAHAIQALQNEFATNNSVFVRPADDTHHDPLGDKQHNEDAYLRKIDPQHLDNHERYEDQKEATLYGYKYNEKVKDPGNQDPWTQGGFVPTKRQADAMRSTYGTDNGNVDGFPTKRMRGIETAPRREIIPVPSARDKKKSPEKQTVPAGPRATRGKKRKYDFESDETETPLDTDTDALPTAESTPGKMTTRYRGLKKPLTRSTSVTPIPLSLNASPAPKKTRAPRAAFSMVAGQISAAAGETPPPGEGAKRVPQKNPNRSAGMRALWKRRKETGWVRGGNKTSKVDSKALAAADKKAEESRRNSATQLQPPSQIQPLNDNSLPASTDTQPPPTFVNTTAPAAAEPPATAPYYLPAYTELL